MDDALCLSYSAEGVKKNETGRVSTPWSVPQGERPEGKGGFGDTHPLRPEKDHAKIVGTG